MSLTIATNRAANELLVRLNQTTRGLSTAFEHLSSGSRISSASDDAAGFGVAENLSARSRSLRQALRNANDGVSVAEISDGAASSVTSILMRMKELAIQATSQTYATTERGYVQSEFGALRNEVDRVASTTAFGGLHLSDGSATRLNVQVGTAAADTVAMSLGDLTATTLGLQALNLSTSTGAQSALSTLDAALDKVNGYRAGFGAAQNELESASRLLETGAGKLDSAESRIRDADFAYESARMSRYKIVQQASIAALVQVSHMNSGVTRLLV